VEEVAGDVAQGARDPSPEQGVGHGQRWLTSSSSNQRRALRHGWSRRARVGSWQVELGQGEKGGCPRPWKKKAPWEPLRTHRRIKGEVARRSQGQRSALRAKILGEGASRKEPWLLGAPARLRKEREYCARG
jgi:hypothetical protein